MVAATREMDGDGQRDTVERLPSTTPSEFSFLSCPKSRSQTALSLVPEGRRI